MCALPSEISAIFQRSALIIKARQALDKAAPAAATASPAPPNRYLILIMLMTNIEVNIAHVMGNIKPSPLFGPAFSQMANLKGRQFYILASGANE